MVFGRNGKVDPCAYAPMSGVLPTISLPPWPVEVLGMELGIYDSAKKAMAGHFASLAVMVDAQTPLIVKSGIMAAGFPIVWQGSMPSDLGFGFIIHSPYTFPAGSQREFKVIYAERVG